MKMKLGLISLAMAALMSFALTGCGTEPVQETEYTIKNTEKVVFSATPSEKEIQVQMEDGGVQKLEVLLDKELYDPTMLIVDDYNFDGYMDIAFPANYNEYNKIYQLWLYNSKTAKFEENADFVNYSNPEIDAKNKQIKAVQYADAVTTSSAVYEWRDGALFCLETEVTTQNENGEEIHMHMVYNEKTKQMESVEVESVEDEKE